MRKLLVPLLAATLTFAAACTNDATSPTVSITGNWSLRTLNGQSVPVTVSTQTGTFTIVSENLTLNPDGSYNDIVNYSNGTSSTEVGFYSVNNNLITFVDQTDNGFQYTGSISGNVLTSTSQSSSGTFTSVYQKT
jgi:hypothetical protein